MTYEVSECECATHGQAADEGDLDHRRLFFLLGVRARGFDSPGVEELALHADVPVMNGLTDLHHPCQVLADLLKKVL